MTRLLGILLTLGVGFWATASLDAANWPQWRGVDGQGVSEERNLPAEWGPARNIAWKAELPGGGQSQPIVWGDRIFLTAAIEGGPAPAGHKAPVHLMEGEPWVHPDSVGIDKLHTLKVLALDLPTGKVLWERTAYEGPVFDHRHRRSSYAAPTMVTDGTTVVAYFGPEGLYGYDFAGNLKWKADAGKFPLLGLGTGTSPVLFENLVILQRDENEGKQSLLLAYDITTGRQVWRTPRTVEASWSTPVIVESAGRPELVANGNQLIVGYDPRTGKELWRTKGVESNAIHTPLVGHGLVIVTAGYPAKKIIAIRPGGSGDITGSDRIVWQYDRGTGYVISPILYGDYVYLVSDKGIISCLDAKTGEVKYEGGRVPVPATFMASPVAFDGKLLLTSIDGDSYVIKAGPIHEVLGTNSIGEPAASTPSISQGRILVRGAKHLYCVKSL
jgi:outer membrane protein assembly factor BamB